MSVFLTPAYQDRKGCVYQRRIIGSRIWRERYLFICVEELIYPGRRINPGKTKCLGDPQWLPDRQVAGRCPQVTQEFIMGYGEIYAGGPGKVFCFAINRMQFEFPFGILHYCGYVRGYVRKTGYNGNIDIDEFMGSPVEDPIGSQQ